MPRKISEAQAKSNREHHLTFFKYWYQDIGLKYAYAMIKLSNLIKELNEIEKDANRTENARRENAFYMGVSLHDSDQVYSLDEVVKGVPKVVEHIRSIMKKYGVEE